MIATDIIGKEEEKKILEQIVASSEEFLQSNSSEINYQRIVDTIADISGAKYAVFNLYNEDGCSFTTRAIFAPKGIVKKATAIIGDKLVGKTWKQRVGISYEIMLQTITPGLSLNDVAGQMIPKHLITLFNIAFNLGEVVFIKIAKENKMIGDFILIMPKNKSFKNDKYIELYTRQIGLLIIHNRSEARLTESEEKYRTLVEKANESICIIQDNILVFANKRAYELMDLPDGDLLGKSFIDYVWPEDREMLASNYQRRLSGESILEEYDFRLIGSQGEPIWVFLSVSLIQYHGRPATLNMVTNINERKKVEKKLQESETRYKTLAEQSRTFTWEVNEQGLYTFVDHVIETILGYRPEDMIYRKHFYDLCPIEGREVFKRGAFEVFKLKEQFINLENKAITKDGCLVWLSTNGIPILRDDGTLLGYHGSDTDITGRKKIEESLKTSEEKYRLLTEHASDVIWVFNLAKGKLTYIGPSVFNLRGLTPKEAINESLEDSMTPESVLVVNDTIARNIEGFRKDPDAPKNYIIEIQQPCKNGDIIWIEISTRARYNAEGQIEVVGVSRNIMDRKKTEKEVLHLGLHDHLTGLYNRRFFEEELKRLDTKRQLPLSFIMGDLNGLKLINDVFGHNAGDELLKKTAEILKKVCRSDDILARWGGDEFVILLPKTSAADSEEIVARIKKECKKTASQKIPMSLSLGASQKETAVQDIQAVIIDAESNMYRNKLAQKESSTSSIIFALDQALYEKSTETKEHTDRICDFALRLGKSINLPSSQLDELSLLASLHDIGKVAISETILLKEGKLTKQEWEVTKRHPEIGFNIASSSPQIAHIAKPILSCHENFDGSGYPLGIAGESIPIISRIILIADAYDVMTNKRSYKKPISKNDAIDELKRCAGSQFDPELVEKFIEIITEEKKTTHNNKEKVLIKQ